MTNDFAHIDRVHSFVIFNDSLVFKENMPLQFLSCAKFVTHHVVFTGFTVLIPILTAELLDNLSFSVVELPNKDGVTLTELFAVNVFRL